MKTSAEQKRTDFLWHVQMIMLRYQDEMIAYSGITGDAIAASYRIPPNMTARDAGLAFCSFFVEGFRGKDNPRPECPHWMTALSDPI